MNKKAPMVAGNKTMKDLNENSKKDSNNPSVGEYDFQRNNRRNSLDEQIIYYTYVTKEADNPENQELLWNDDTELDSSTIDGNGIVVYNWQTADADEILYMPVEGYSSKSIGPNTIYLKELKDVEIPLTLNGNEFWGIQGLKRGRDYTFDRDTSVIILHKTFLETAFLTDEQDENDPHMPLELELEFVFDNGASWHEYLIKCWEPVFGDSTGEISDNENSVVLSIPADYKGNKIKRVYAFLNGQPVGPYASWWPYLQNGYEYTPNYGEGTLDIHRCFFDGNTIADGTITLIMDCEDDVKCQYYIRKNGNMLTGLSGKDPIDADEELQTQDTLITEEPDIPDASSLAEEENAPVSTSVETISEADAPTPEAVATEETTDFIPEMSVTSLSEDRKEQMFEEAIAEILPEMENTSVPEETVISDSSIAEPTLPVKNQEVSAIETRRARATHSRTAPSVVSSSPAIRMNILVKTEDAVYRISSTGTPTVKYVSPISKRAKILIPPRVTIDGITYKVTAVDAGAFRNNKTIKAVSIPETVKVISKDAFSGCKNLTRVLIPASVNTLGSNSFRGCINLTKIMIPEGITYIGTDAFKGARNLKYIVIHAQGIKTIRNGAFSGINRNAMVKITSKKVNALGRMAIVRKMKRAGLARSVKIRYL